jgi:hypothetical protein
MFYNIYGCGDLCVNTGETNEFPYFDTSLYASPFWLTIPPQTSIMVHFDSPHIMHTLTNTGSIQREKEEEEEGEELPAEQDRIENREQITFVPCQEDLAMWLINTSYVSSVVIPKDYVLKQLLSESFFLLAYFTMVPQCHRDALVPRRCRRLSQVSEFA